MKADSQLQRNRVVDGVDVLPANEYQPMDAEIALAALNALRGDTEVPPRRFSVNVKNGIVTLLGTADWYYQRGAAARAVRFLAGVRDVRNQIKVAPPVTALDVKRRINDALHRGICVDASRIQVEATDGEVTLTGSIRAACERKDAVLAAASAPGVRVVNDQLHVLDP